MDKKIKVTKNWDIIEDIDGIEYSELINKINLINERLTELNIIYNRLKREAIYYSKYFIINSDLHIVRAIATDMNPDNIIEKGKTFKYDEDSEYICNEEYILNKLEFFRKYING